MCAFYMKGKQNSEMPCSAFWVSLTVCQSIDLWVSCYNELTMRTATESGQLTLATSCTNKITDLNN